MTLCGDSGMEIFDIAGSDKMHFCTNAEMYGIL